jgi:hypothetical protein
VRDTTGASPGKRVRARHGQDEHGRESRTPAARSSATSGSPIASSRGSTQVSVPLIISSLLI